MYGISMVDKSLVTIENQNIQMHNLLQELGRKLVRGKFLKNPEKWNRLWLYKDFHLAMTAEPGGMCVEALVLDQGEEMSELSPLKAEKFSKMRDLRLLILYHKNLSGDLNFLSNKLQYLSWHGYPFPSLPSSFEPDRLVELHMPASSIKRLWEGIKQPLNSSRTVDLSNSNDLETASDFKKIPKLERLDLMECTNLSEIHLSIGRSLQKLTFLSLRNCSNLDSLTLDGGSESNSSSLEVLDLTGCTKLARTPDFSSIPNLERLDLTGCTNLRELHPSIGSLQKLAFLILRNCSDLVSRLNGDRKLNLSSLKVLDLTGCTNLARTPDFRRIPNLELLDLSGCIKLSKLHSSIKSLKKLAILIMQNCSNVVNLISDEACESYLSSLKVLNLSGCTNLAKMPDFRRMPNLEWLNLEQCTSLSKVDESIGGLSKLKFLRLRYCTNLVNIAHSVHTIINSLEILDFHGCPELESLPLTQRTRCAVASLESFRLFQFLIFLDLGFCDLSEVTAAIGDLCCLERLNLEGNNFVTVPSTMKELSRLVYLNLSHCNELQSFPELPSPSTSSNRRYFSTVVRAHSHRSGLYIFNCPNLRSSSNLNSISGQSNYLACLWLTRLLQEPRCFRSGFDIVIPGSRIPEWFDQQLIGGSIKKEQWSDVEDDNNWIGVTFCVAFMVNPEPETSVSSYDAVDRQPRSTFYLASGGERVEWSLDMPLRLDLVDVDDSQHLWLIYISREHCRFLETGMHVTSIAPEGLKVKNWALRWVLKQDMEPQNGPLRSLETGRSRQVHHPHHPLHVRDGSSSSGPKIGSFANWLNRGTRFLYSWLITKEKEEGQKESRT